MQKKIYAVLSWQLYNSKHASRMGWLKLTDKIFNMYEMYHCEDLQNAFDDIERMCAR